MKNAILKISILTLFLATFLSCKKISAPNEEAKKIFGTWFYDSNTGGFSGNGGSTRFTYNSYVTFTEKGYFKMDSGTQAEKQRRFTIEMKETIHDSVQRPALVYKDGNYETYVITNDTLYLFDEAYDGYIYRFIKK